MSPAASCTIWMWFRSVSGRRAPSHMSLTYRDTRKAAEAGDREDKAVSTLKWGDWDLPALVPEGRLEGNSPGLCHWDSPLFSSIGVPYPDPLIEGRRRESRPHSTWL